MTNKLENRFKEVTMEAKVFTENIAPKLAYQVEQSLKASNELLNSKPHELVYVQKDIERALEETEAFINEHLKEIQKTRNYIQSGVFTVHTLENEEIKNDYLFVHGFMEDIKRNIEELNKLLTSTKELYEMKVQA